MNSTKKSKSSRRAGTAATAQKTPQIPDDWTLESVAKHLQIVQKRILHDDPVPSLTNDLSDASDVLLATGELIREFLRAWDELGFDPSVVLRKRVKTLRKIVEGT